MNLWCALPYLLVPDFISDFLFYEYYRINCFYLALSFVSTCFLFIILSCLRTVWLNRLGLWWHEIKVYRWGFPCLDYSFDVLVSWNRNLKPYNQIAYPWLCMTCAYPCSPLGFASLLAWGVSLTPLDPHVQVMELGACRFSLLRIRVAQR